MKAHIRRLTSGFYAVWAKHNDGTISLLDAACQDRLAAEKLAQQFLLKNSSAARQGARA